MNIIQPCKVGLRVFNIEGVNLRQHVQGISIYETMCKPYLTATISINDNTNLINELKLRGGEKVSIVIDPGLGKLYETVQYITKIEDEQSPENFRSINYKIYTASESFFNDRASIVQRSDVNIPATSAAQAIHQEFIGKDAPLNLQLPSIGMIAKNEIGGFLTTNKKPFKAIQDILNRCSYGNLKTGSTVYFRNAEEYIIAPLEHLFNSMSAQEHFIQKQTWGSSIHDTFNAYNAIIQASTKVNESDKQRGGAVNMAAATKGALNVFDVAKGKEVIMKAASEAQKFGNSLSSLSKFTKGKYGGLPNVFQMDSRRNEPSTDQSLNSVEENMFQAQVKDSVNYYIKVPIQSGINVTVGRGFNAKLLPPVGSLNKGKSNIGGLMLAADVCHECIFTHIDVQGTTTIRGVQISYNV